MSDITTLMMAAAGQGGDYQISRSLRFNSADDAYLTKTFGSAGNRKTWTWSSWVKLSKLANSFENQDVVFSGWVDNNNRSAISFQDNATNKFDFFNITSNSINARLTTTQAFRDFSAWYHVMIVVDTTQATDTNRLKMYVNGVQVTTFDTATYPAQNADLQINTAAVHDIGTLRDSDGTVGPYYYDGYLTEINFIDGQALTPSSFGETDAVTGVWKPIRYAGTYGTNGFHLDFSDNTSTTTLGYDAAGSNDWTLNNFSVTAGAGNDSLVDSPTRYGTDTGAGGEVRGNYCTLNPLANNGGTLANGNLDHTGTTALTASTLFPSTGKWYCEFTCTAYGGGASLGYTAVGVIQSSQSINTIPSSLGAVPVGLWIYRNDAQKANNGASASYGNTWTANDVIGIAVDLDAGKLWFAKNGTWQASGDPVAGTNAAYTNLSGSIAPAINDQGSYSSSFSFNAGQRPFAYTAPSGFKALCTTNLPDPTVVQGDDYFNTVLYTGTGSSLGVTGVGFQPDFVWIKERSGAADHGLYDAVRGTTKQLESNTTTAETTEATGLTAFGADGFTVGALAQLNTSADTYVAWNWKANGAGVSNTAGTISSTVSVSTTSGFSIVTYTGTGANATVGHGLGIAPKMVIVKNRETAGNSWCTWHTGLTSGAYALFLDATNAQGNFPTIFNSTIPTSTVFSIGTATGTNENTKNILAYCFAPVAGFSAFGSYTGNGSTDGPFIYTGFRPRYILFKRTDSTGNWFIRDTSRDPYNVGLNYLMANSSDAEASSGSELDTLSNGFKWRVSSVAVNGSGGTFIYAAFAENPFKNSLAR